MKATCIILTFIMVSIQSFGLSLKGKGLKIREDAVIDASTVRLISGNPANGGTINSCTATVLSDRHLLTAAHCMDELDVKRSVILLQKFIGHKVVQDDDTKPLSPGTFNVFVHPDFSRDHLYKSDNNDLAIIKFSDSSYLKGLYPVRLPEVDLLGLKGKYYVVGAGGYSSRKESIRSQPKEVRKRLRLLNKEQLTAFFALIEPYTKDLRMEHAKYQARTANGRSALNLKMQNRALVCKGDSGGPTFFSNGNGVYQVGVHSYINVKRSVENTCGTYLYDTSVFDNVSWIKKTLKK